VQIQIKGEMTIGELRQEIFEKLNELENDHAVRHSRYATLYLTPTNGFGDEVYVRNAAGRKIEKLCSEGPYRSAADDFNL